MKEKRREKVRESKGEKVRERESKGEKSIPSCIVTQFSTYESSRHTRATRNARGSRDTLKEAARASVEKVKHRVL